MVWRWAVWLGGVTSTRRHRPQADTTAVAGKLVSLEGQARRRDLNLAVKLDAVPHLAFQPLRGRNL
jgi:hypothetical protein